MNTSECTEEQAVVPYSRRALRAQRLYNQLYGNSYYQTRKQTFTPAMEISETTDGFKVWVELAGVAESDVETTLNNGYLIISGTKNSPSGDNEDVCACSERSFGHFERIIPVSNTIDADGVKAKMTNGVLEVDLPKREEAKPRKIDIDS